MIQNVVWVVKIKRTTFLDDVVADFPTREKAEEAYHNLSLDHQANPMVADIGLWEVTTTEEWEQLK